MHSVHLKVLKKQGGIRASGAFLLFFTNWKIGLCFLFFTSYEYLEILLKNEYIVQKFCSKKYYNSFFGFESMPMFSRKKVRNRSRKELQIKNQTSPCGFFCF